MNPALVMVVLFTGMAALAAGGPLIINAIVAPRKPSPSKLEAYECGTQTVGDPWARFGVQYYVYALLFVVFDVEVIYLFPWAVVFKQFMANGQAMIVLGEMAVFLGILVIGLIYAWGTRTLEWD